MIKKLSIGLIGIVLVGLLIYGGLFRSNFKLTGDLNPPGLNLGSSEARGGYGQGQPREESEANNERGGWGNGGRTVVDLEWKTLEGTVTAVSETTITIAAADGTPIVLENRPWQYALSMGFSVKTGDKLILTGFYETPETFTAAGIQNITSGASVKLRDESGRPMWSGRNGRG
jgi:hypothetical protein